MKYLALVFASVLVSTQSFAASNDDDEMALCESKLNLVNHYESQKGSQKTGTLVPMFDEYKDEAEKARESGDMAKCVQSADQALRVYQKAHHK